MVAAVRREDPEDDGDDATVKGFRPRTERRGPMCSRDPSYCGRQAGSHTLPFIGTLENPVPSALIT
jgi:hypothetical protein